jgi:hypothetical protein
LTGVSHDDLMSGASLEKRFADHLFPDFDVWHDHPGKKVESFMNQDPRMDLNKKS